MAGAQLLLRKQRMPKWTKKAALVCLLAFGLTVAASMALTLSPAGPDPLLLASLALLQPAAVVAAWACLLPLDRRLKSKVFAAARARRAALDGVTVIGIAGSVGKTTAKELLRLALRDLDPLTTPAHVNTEMGVAQWLLRETAGGRKPDVLIVEMGAYREGEIALLAEVIRPTLGVLTAVGSDHLALFGSEEAIVRANGELLAALPADGAAFVYADSDGAREAARLARCPVTFCGHREEAEVRPAAFAEEENGIRLTINGQELRVPLHGRHSAGNALLAWAVARRLGTAPARIAELLAEFSPLPGTFRPQARGTVTVVDDTYNVSPLSFRAALDWAASRDRRPRTLLTSGLLETGAEEDRFLRELGALAAESVERAIFTADRGRAAFAAGFGKEVELLSEKTPKVPENSLLLCVGRMPPSSIRAVLP